MDRANINGVQGSTPFLVNESNFAISPSAEGYTLEWSVDGVIWETADEVAADTNWVVTNAPCGLWYRLDGNQSLVKLAY